MEQIIVLSPNFKEWTEDDVGVSFDMQLVLNEYVRAFKKNHVAPSLFPETLAAINLVHRALWSLEVIKLILLGGRLLDKYKHLWCWDPAVRCTRLIAARVSGKREVAKFSLFKFKENGEEMG